MTRQEAQAELKIINEAIHNLLLSPKQVSVSGGISYTARDLPDLEKRKQQLIIFIFGGSTRKSYPYWN